MQPIILLSLPRSGSTLVQRCLAAHPAIYSTSESWLLLPGAYMLRENGVVSEYGHSVLQKGVSDFCDGMPEKEKDFYREYGEMVARLYEKRSGSDEHKYFLEKTPRNLLIVDEVFSMFPTAKVILLWRDPVRIYASMIRSLLRNKWKPGIFNVDITEGVKGLCQAIDKYPGRVKTIRYEDFVSDPEKSLGKLTDFLELKYHDGMTDLADSDVLHGSLGDKTGILKYKRISTESLDSGLEEAFHNTYRIRYMKKLLKEWEAKGFLTSMGYSYESLLGELPSGRSSYQGVVTDFFTENSEKMRMRFQSVGLLQAIEARQKLFY